MSEEAKKPTAFVMQTFDGQRFDRRYAETIRPALIRAGADPVRADKILGLQPIVQKIEQAIRDASICVAEVSVDNPNVWLELGYALALDRPTVILCDRALRERLPFDIQHRPVIFYSTDSKSGYDQLEQDIVAVVQNELASASRLEAAPALQPAGAADTKDLKGYEVAVLTAVMAVWPTSPEGVSGYEINKALSKTDYSEAQIAIGISKLVQSEYLEQHIENNRDGYDISMFRLTPAGMKWLHQNEDLVLPVKRVRPAMTSRAEDPFPDDEIPF